MAFSLRTDPDAEQVTYEECSMCDNQFIYYDQMYGYNPFMEGLSSGELFCCKQCKEDFLQLIKDSDE